MDNELIVKKTWWTRNWKWLVPTCFIIISIVVGAFLNSSIHGNVSDMVQAYSDDSLYEKAIEKAKTNKRVLEVIGTLEPIDKLAILEGNALYSNHNNSVEVSVRVNGNKGKGKMDIVADKAENEWEFKKITLRIKDPKEKIQILNDTMQ